MRKEITEIVGSVASDWNICKKLTDVYKHEHPSHSKVIDEAFLMLQRPFFIHGDWAYGKFVKEQLDRAISGGDLTETTNVEVVAAIAGASVTAPIHGVQMLTALNLCAQSVFDSENPVESEIRRRLAEDASVGHAEESKKIIAETRKKLKYRKAAETENAPVEVSIQGRLF